MIKYLTPPSPPHPCLTLPMAKAFWAASLQRHQHLASAEARRRLQSHSMVCPMGRAVTWPRSPSRSAEHVLEGPRCTTGEPRGQPSKPNIPPFPTVKILFHFQGKLHFSCLFSCTWEFNAALVAKQQKIKNCCKFVLWIVKQLWKLLQTENCCKGTENRKFCFPHCMWCSVSRVTGQDYLAHLLLYRSPDQDLEFKKTQLLYKIN